MIFYIQPIQIHHLLRSARMPIRNTKSHIGITTTFFVIDGTKVVTLSVEGIEASNLVSTSIETLALMGWIRFDAHAP